MKNWKWTWRKWSDERRQTRRTLGIFDGIFTCRACSLKERLSKSIFGYAPVNIRFNSQNGLRGKFILIVCNRIRSDDRRCHEQKKRCDSNSQRGNCVIRRIVFVAIIEIYSWPVRNNQRWLMLTSAIDETQSRANFSTPSSKNHTETFRKWFKIKMEWKKDTNWVVSASYFGLFDFPLLFLILLFRYLFLLLLI